LRLDGKDASLRKFAVHASGGLPMDDFPTVEAVPQEWIARFWPAKPAKITKKII
jgi:hypothetical protein